MVMEWYSSDWEGKFQVLNDFNIIIYVRKVIHTLERHYIGKI